MVVRFSGSLPAAPKFSAFIIHDTGRTTSGGKPVYNYELTGCQKTYSLDSVIWKGWLVGRSDLLGEFSKLLNKYGPNAQTNQFFKPAFLEMMRDKLVEALKLEAWQWRIPEDLGQREKLMQDSDLDLHQEFDGTFTMTITKPTPPKVNILTDFNL